MKSSRFFKASVLFLFCLGGVAFQAHSQILADKTSGCLPLVVSFEIENRDYETVEWQTQDGQTSNTVTPTFIFEEVGDWEVSALLTLESGDVENLTYESVISVYDKPQVDFSIVNNSSCLGQSISFNNLTTGANSYLWSFGDGNQSTAENPSHQYQEPGVYIVTLTAKINGFCQEIKVVENAVDIGVAEEVGLTASRFRQCLTDNEPINFSVDGDLTDVEWDFGDGNVEQGASVNYFFEALGEYQVSVSYVNELGCSKTDVLAPLIVVEEIQIPEIEVSEAIICLGGDVTLSAIHPASSGFRWEIGNQEFEGKEITLTLDQVGDQDVTLTYTDNVTCAVSVFEPALIAVQEVEPVTIDYGQIAGCEPFNFIAKNTTEGAVNFSWKVNGEIIAGSELQHTFENPGQYQIVAVTEFETGCTIETELEDEIQVFEKETEVRVSEWTGCAPFDVELELLGKGASNIRWNLEGSDLTGSSVNHQFENPGVYYPTVSYVNESGCEVDYVFETPISVLSREITLGEPEIIESCTYTEVHFNGVMGYDSWAWDFGDGSTSNEKNPTHSYEQSGTYEVSLTTFNKNGCETTVDNYNIIEIPDLEVQTSFDVTAGAECGYFSVVVQADLAEGQNAYWYYNNNLLSTNAELTVSFISLADVGITLNISSEGGCIKSKAIMIPNPWEDCENPEIEEEMEETAGESPIGKFQFSSCNLPYTIDILNPVPSAKKFQWRFEDGKNHSQESFTQTFSVAGEHKIGYWARIDEDSTLWVEDYITVSIYQSEINFEYEIEKVCEGFEITLIPLNSEFKNYIWKLNNQAIELSAAGSYFIEKEGLYSISLSANGQNNCATTKIKNIYLGSQENQFQYPKSSCLDEGVTVEHALSGFQEIKWDMGNGEVIANFDNPYHYSAAGEYLITALATDIEGCTYEFTLPQKIKILNPRPDFSANKTIACGETTISFQNKSEGATAWLWDFGNGITSTAENPKVVYMPGIYSVTLSARNGECTETVSKSDFIVIEELTSDFSFQYNQACLPINIDFQDQSINAVSWFWDFGDGNTSTEQNPSHTYHDFPRSKVTLTVANESGCKVTKKQTMDFMLSAAFEVDDNKVCLGKSSYFSATSDNAVSWIWDFGDGSSSTERDPSHTYATAGRYDVTLIAQSADGCQDTVFMQQIVEVIPAQADFELLESISSNCVPVQVSFTDLSVGAVSYFWDFGDGKTSKVTNPTHLYSKVGDFDVTLVITNELGCQDTIHKAQLVKVSGPETKFEIDNKIICLPNTAKFTDLSATAVEWQWIFGDGNTSNVQHPEHFYENPGVYTVTLIAKNEQGCEQIYKIEDVKVLPTPNVDFEMEIDGECFPVEVKLSNRSSNLLKPSYLWDFGDGQTSTEESPTILIEKTGEFTVSLIVKNDEGCPVKFTHHDQVLVRDTVAHREANLNQILVENNIVKFEIEPYNHNNISHYNVYRDSPSGFYLLQTISVEGQSNQRIIFDDQTCRPQDMSHEYIFQAVSFCEDTISKDQLTIFNTIMLSRKSEQEELRKVDWNNSKGFTVDNQRIFRKTKGSEQWQEIAVMDTSALSFHDQEDLCPGIYQYRLGAFEKNSLRSISNYVEFEVSEEIYINQVAEIQNSTVMETGEVFIEWIIPEEGKDRVSAFEIYRSENGSRYEYFDSVQPHEQLYIDKEANTENSTYQYQIKVVNECSINTENSGESNTVLLQKDVQFRKYELRWNAFKGWEEGVKKYIIQRLNENGEWETVEEVSGNQLKTIIRDTKD